MAKKNKKSRITNIQMKKIFKQNNIRDCQVNLVRLTLTNSTELQKALLREYGILDCAVKIVRLTENDILTAQRKKTLCLKPKINNVRQNVSWLPTSSSTKKNSVEAVSALATYHHQHSIAQPVAKKNVKRQRAKSMFAERNRQPGNTGEKKCLMDDMHLELSARYNSPKKGLKPSTDRQLPELQPPPLSEFQKIYNELKAKLAAKKSKTD